MQRDGCTSANDKWKVVWLMLLRKFSLSVPWNKECANTRGAQYTDFLVSVLSHYQAHERWLQAGSNRRRMNSWLAADWNLRPRRNISRHVRCSFLLDCGPQPETKTFLQIGRSISAISMESRHLTILLNATFYLNHKNLPLWRSFTVELFSKDAAARSLRLVQKRSGTICISTFLLMASSYGIILSTRRNRKFNMYCSVLTGALRNSKPPPTCFFIYFWVPHRFCR